MQAGKSARDNATNQDIVTYLCDAERVANESKAATPTHKQQDEARGTFSACLLSLFFAQLCHVPVGGFKRIPFSDLQFDEKADIKGEGHFGFAERARWVIFLIDIDLLLA
jgi:hypothetical protein